MSPVVKMILCLWSKTRAFGHINQLRGVYWMTDDRNLTICSSPHSMGSMEAVLCLKTDYFPWNPGLSPVSQTTSFSKAEGKLHLWLLRRPSVKVRTQGSIDVHPHSEHKVRAHDSHRNRPQELWRACSLCKSEQKSWMHKARTAPGQADLSQLRSLLPVVAWIPAMVPLLINYVS